MTDIADRTEWTNAGRITLAAQPFSQLIGVRLISLSRTGAELALALRPELNQHLGQVHGGVVGFLADNAIAFAAGPHLGTDIVTSDLALNFCRAARGESLIARAKVDVSGKTKAAVRCEVFSVDARDERLCAIAIGTVLKR